MLMRGNATPALMLQHWPCPLLFNIVVTVALPPPMNRQSNARHGTNIRATYLVVYFRTRKLYNTIFLKFLEIGYVHVSLAEIN